MLILKRRQIMKKILIALDFDHTVINGNSDTFIYELAPNKKIPEDIKQLYRTDGWTFYMGEVFKFLHRNGVTGKEMLDHLSYMPLTDGMKDLFLKLSKFNTEFIIISDSNTIFIEHILKHYKIDKYFFKIFTNYAKFDETGCLAIDKYHNQNWCSLSTNNLCKGHILSKFVESRMKEGIHFTNIAYVGDGANDFCPCLRLSECDLAYPRMDYNLVETIKKMKLEKGLHIKSKVIPWKSGNDIINSLLPYCRNMENMCPPNPRLYEPGFI